MYETFKHFFNIINVTHSQKTKAKMHSRKRRKPSQTFKNKAYF